MKSEYCFMSDGSHALAHEHRSPIRGKYVAHPLLLGVVCTLMVALSGCGQEPADPQARGLTQEDAELRHRGPHPPHPPPPPPSTPSPVPTDWQPFTKDAVWNLLLPAQRQETPLPAAGLAVAPFTVNDGPYGINLYFASASDPNWAFNFGNFDSATDIWPPPNPATVRAPLGITPPTGTDGTIIVVDENQKYVYEMWQVSVNSRSGTPPRAYSSGIAVPDLTSNGIHRNVGVTGSGLPGVGGLLRSSDIASGKPIRHKIWLAVNPALLFANAVWPAPRFDASSNGAYAALNYGDVVALSQSYPIATGQCNLSPVMQRVAQALQDFGGIVQDQGGDAVSLVSEVGALSSHLDISQSAMWSQLQCLRQYLVKVNSPWTGATQGGLGY